MSRKINYKSKCRSFPINANTSTVQFQILKTVSALSDNTYNNKKSKPELLTIKTTSLCLKPRTRAQPPKRGE
jgi:hypothetical protein